MTYAKEFLIAAISSKRGHLEYLEKEIKRLENDLSELKDKKQEVIWNIDELNTVLERLTKNKP